MENIILKENQKEKKYNLNYEEAEKLLDNFLNTHTINKIGDNLKYFKLEGNNKNSLQISKVLMNNEFLLRIVAKFTCDRKKLLLDKDTKNINLQGLNDESMYEKNINNNSYNIGLCILSNNQNMILPNDKRFLEEYLYTLSESDFILNNSNNNILYSNSFEIKYSNELKNDINNIVRNLNLKIFIEKNIDNVKTIDTTNEMNIDKLSKIIEKDMPIFVYNKDKREYTLYKEDSNNVKILLINCNDRTEYLLKEIIKEEISQVKLGKTAKKNKLI